MATSCRDEAEKLSQYHEQRALLVLHRRVRKRTRGGVKADVAYSVVDMDEHAWWNVHRAVLACHMQLDAVIGSLSKNRDRVLAGTSCKQSPGMMVS